MQYNYSLGYVIGVLNGDGSLFKGIDYHYFDHKSRQVVKAKAVRRVPRYRYTFALNVMDKDFADAFADHLQKLTGKRPCQWMTKIGAFKVILISKEWYERLFPLKTDLEWIKTADVEVKKAFLRGMFDSDGCAWNRKTEHGRSNYGHRVSLAKSEAKLKFCQELLTEFGVVSYIHPTPNENCSSLTFGNKQSIRLFRENIGFYIKRKRDILES